VHARQKSGFDRGADPVYRRVNLFLTLFNYRTGKRLFVGYDGFLRMPEEPAAD
jgi:hypothetical protein